MKAIHNIDPIFDETSKILILGSMPSIISRDNKFFYSHPQNRFWKILEILFSKELLTAEDKKIFLIESHIALWDVIKSCDIDSSSDSSIKNIEVNNLNLIVDTAKINAIFCTGKTSFQLLKKYFDFNIPTFCLPSSSSANAKYTIEMLVSEYSIIKDYLIKN